MPAERNLTAINPLACDPRRCSAFTSYRHFFQIRRLVVLRSLALAVVLKLLRLAKVRPLTALQPISDKTETSSDLHESRVCSNTGQFRPEQDSQIELRLKARISDQ